MAANSYRAKFLDSLTDSACEISKKLALGMDISDNELIFLRMYLRELKRQEQIPLFQRVMNNVKQASKFMKQNFGGLLGGASENGIDDYAINTSMEE